MIGLINSAAFLWSQWMGSMFWQVSLLIVLVMFIDMAIRRRAWPHVRYVLWGLVFLKLLIPPTWQMPTGIVSLIQPTVSEHIPIQIENKVLFNGGTPTSKITEPSQNQVEKSVAVEKATWQTTLFLIWIAGMLFFVLMLAIQTSRLPKRSQRRNDRDAPEWFSAVLDSASSSLQLKKTPSVIFSRDAGSPAVYGLFHPVLVLPKGYFEDLTREKVEHVLLHELCHIKRGDLWVHWFCILLQIVYWFNPLFILARRQMGHVSEICCDLSVAYVLREKTAAYRETLLSTSRRFLADTVEPGMGLLGIFEEPSRIVARLKWLERKTWENRKRKIAATMVTILIMVGFVMPMAGHSLTAQEEALIVSINKDGQVFISDDEVSVDSIGEKLLKILEGRESREVFIIADKTVPYGVVVRVMSEIKAAGIEKLGMLTDPEAPAGESVAAVLASLKPKEDMSLTPRESIAEIRVDGNAQISDDAILRVIGSRPGDEYLPQKLSDDLKAVYNMGYFDDIRILEDDSPEGKIVTFQVVEKPTVKHIEFKENSTIPTEGLEENVDNEGAPSKGNAASNAQNDIVLNMVDTDITVLIETISRITGKTFIIDNNVKGKVNVVSPENITKDEAYRLFESVLEMNGFALEPAGKFIKVVPVSTATPGEAERPLTTRISLRRSQVDSAMANLTEPMTQVTIVPYSYEGVEGFELSNIKPNSIFRRMGLRNGDVLVAVEGQPLASADQAYILFEALKSSDTFSLGINREGRVRTIEYRIW